MDSGTWMVVIVPIVLAMVIPYFSSKSERVYWSGLAMVAMLATGIYVMITASEPDHVDSPVATGVLLSLLPIVVSSLLSRIRVLQRHKRSLVLLAPIFYYIGVFVGVVVGVNAGVISL